VTASTTNSWVCRVCGYVHRGPEPPLVCPVCGAPQSEFEPHAEPEPEHPKPTQWLCMVCGCVHDGPEPPEVCPDCGAGADCFEAQTPSQTDHADAADGPGLKIVVAGAGIAGLSAVEAVRNASSTAEIVLYSKEAALPYYRLNLTRYVAGEIGDTDLPVHPESWYEENAIRLVPGEEISAIDPEKRLVRLSGGSEESFDKLILTAGAHPFVPPIPGADQEGVIAFRTAEDARHIVDAAKSGAKCVCIGGGILGMETAGALAKRGADVTLFEGSPWVMPRQLNDRAGAILKRHAEGLGVTLLTNVRIAELSGDGHVTGVKLEDETVIDAGLVVIATGVRSNSHLARRARLEVNQGVVVNNHLQTSHPDIFAAGDMAEHRGIVYGIWPASQFQGTIAGMNAMGQATEFAGIPRSNTLKVLGIDLVSIGAVNAEDGSYSTIEEEGDGTYLRFLFRDSRLAGAILMGDTSSAPAAKKAIEKRLSLSDLLDRKPAAREFAELLKRGPK
jgi:NAD(P)H-nitrite reductase large subunit/rubredoxin